jgi:hypothetical protein
LYLQKQRTDTLTRHPVQRPYNDDIETPGLRIMHKPRPLMLVTGLPGAFVFCVDVDNLKPALFAELF